MPVVDDNDTFRARLREIEEELAKRNQYIKSLEKANREMEARLKEAGEAGQSTAELSDLEETLKKFVIRIAMILQGGRCLFMIHDATTNELVADTPTLGFEESDLKSLRIPVGKGISGRCWSENRAVLTHDAQNDPAAIEEGLAKLGVRNGVCVPLIIYKRDDETNRVLDRRTIGVLHVFDKKYGSIFLEEDVQLLQRLADNAAAIINNAETYRRVVRDKEELVETIESLYAGLVMVNKNGRITQMNASARQIFGLKPEDLTGSRPYDSVITDEKIRDVLGKALSEEGALGVMEEISVPTPDNADRHRIFQVQSAQVRNEGGDLIGMAAIFNDITEIKNVDKMKTAFVSTVSHELRTPLTAIKGFISTLVQDTEGFYDEGTRHEFYTIIDTECDRLRRLIDDLLNVSRIESGNALTMNTADVDVRSVVDKVIMIQNGSTYKKPEHTVRAEIDESMPAHIQADEDMMNQILANLISNALKYSPKGGEIVVRGKRMSDEMVQMSVSDQGMGIPKEQLSKMFQRFHRVDNRDTREIGGTGIGLFLVKNLVETHHGNIWLESEVGKGTTFFFALPIVQPEEDENDGGQNLSSRVSS